MIEGATGLAETSDDPAPGYMRRIIGRAELVAHKDVFNALAAVITRYGTLYDWARSATKPFVLRGRAPVYVAHVPDSLNIDLVVRHAWHGGMFAPVTRDLFTRPTRAPNELRICRRLRALNIGTPELMAYALYEAAPGLVRFDVASRYIPDSYDFAVVLSGLSPVITRAEAIDAIEILLRAMAQNGFKHPDLNVKNVLLSEMNRRTVASILDVDVMEHDVQQSAADVMLANVTRLVRSMVKSRRQFGVHITDDEIEAFRKRMMAAIS